MIYARKMFVALLLIVSTPSVFAADTATNNPIAVIETSKGTITLELYPNEAPVTVANFIDYAQSGFYRGTIFHRVIKKFMIQGGGYTRQMKEKYTKPAIVNESGNGLHNDRWTIAMARTNDPDSASSQFFINTKMNSRLDAQAGQPGYAVFGMVIDGLDVVKAIEKSSTMTFDNHQNFPVEPIIIEKVEIK
ncbi:MAG: peptidylprolyl isomerase [Oceanicoccus sp.]